MKLFAASGSCFDSDYIIEGHVDGVTFKSDEFIGTMNGQHFWNKLATLAKEKEKFIKLMYK